MQPVLSRELPTDDEWSCELKWDGYRLIARKAGDKVSLWSRNGRSHRSVFPRIVEAVAALPVDEVTIDGEAVVVRGDGRPDFFALSSKAAGHAILIAFDLLNIEGADQRRLALDERRRQLSRLLAKTGKDVAASLWFSTSVTGPESEVLFRHACALGLEGVIAKRRATGYRSGASKAWRKVLCPGYIRPEEGTA